MSSGSTATDHRHAGRMWLTAWVWGRAGCNPARPPWLSALPVAGRLV